MDGTRRCAGCGWTFRPASPERYCSAACESRIAMQGIYAGLPQAAAERLAPLREDRQER
jgi:rubredoxin